MGLAAGGQVLLPADTRWGGFHLVEQVVMGRACSPAPPQAEHSFGGGGLNSPQLCATTSPSLDISGACVPSRPTPGTHTVRLGKDTAHTNTLRKPKVHYKV